MSFQNLTIGKKITLGFGLSFAVLAVVAVIAYTAVNGAGRRFALLSESARETYAAAMLESSMQGVKLQVNDFLATGSDASIAAVDAAGKTLNAELDAAAKLMQDRERAQEIAKARQLLAAYDAAFRELVANHRARQAVEQTVLAPQSKAIADGLQQMLKQAQTQGDMSAAFRISNGLKALFESTSLVNGFLLDSDPQKAVAADAALKVTVTQIQAMEKEQLEMEKLDATLKDDAKKALLAALQQAAVTYAKGLQDLDSARLLYPLGLPENIEVELRLYNPMQGSLNASFETLSAYHGWRKRNSPENVLDRASLASPHLRKAAFRFYPSLP